MTGGDCTQRREGRKVNANIILRILITVQLMVSEIIARKGAKAAK